MPIEGGPVAHRVSILEIALMARPALLGLPGLRA